jgi:hypothetical protein
VGWNADPTVRITLHFRDDDGASSTHIINVAAAALPVAGAFATAYAALFTPLSSCALWKISISLRYLNDTDPVAAAGTDRNRRSVFLFGLADGGRYALSLPGVASAKLLQPPDPYAWVGLNTADPDIAALVAAMTTGIGGTAPCAPWDSLGGSWGGWNGSGGSYGGGSAGGSFPTIAVGDFTWVGVTITELLTAYWGYEREGRR